MRATFEVNGREYAGGEAPVVVVCIDGSEPAYHEKAIAAGRMPWLSRLLEGQGTLLPAHCAMPALTNPNNLSIATGRPPSVHGICGNYIFDTQTGEEVLMNDKRFLRAPTLFAAANEGGCDVVVVTAKDKLRRLLGAGIVEDGPSLSGGAQFEAPSRRGICFSAEKADEATIEENGITDVLELVGRPLASVYSADLSEFVLAAGVKILQTQSVDLMYLTLTDYIQHKHAPGTETATAFYEMIDRYCGELDALGAVVVITADHGMSAKSHEDGTPRVIFVEDEVRRILKEHGQSGDQIDQLRVVLPITDPYTVHHGALGSFATVYLPDTADVSSITAALLALPGIQGVHDRDVAAEMFSLPADRIGDIVVLAESATALGRNPAWHDLEQLDAPLRSHGALGEIDIPFIVNRPLPEVGTAGPIAPDLVHNYDAFWVATTLVASIPLAAATD